MDIKQGFSLQIDGSTSPSDILPLLRELARGLINHSQWIKVLHKALICNDDPDQNDLSEDAHHLCNFGQWYYKVTIPELKNDPCFIEVGELHIVVHNKARDLLKNKISGNQISSEMYEDFNTKANEFRVAVQDLQFSLISKVCAVDHLTGVWNRHAMDHMVSREQERARRTGNSCAVAIMDFDDFKLINDKYGHFAGDEVLKKAIDFFVKRLRKYDIIFRYGGDEFLLLFPETGLEHAQQLLDRLRLELKAIHFDINTDDRVNISISVGMSEIDGHLAYIESINLADQALLEAKTDGRDCIRVWRIE